MNKNRKLRLGMVGGGEGAFIGGVHRIAAAMDYRYELTAGCFSRDYENTKRTGSSLAMDESRLYADYEEMAEKEKNLPEDVRIDAVAIVTPNKSHFSIAKKFLECGFHVICDKPMTFTIEEAGNLVSLVEETGLVFALTHNYTGNPMVREAKELFSSGKLGTVRKVVGEYLQEFLNEPLEKEGMKQAVWRTDPEQSGIGGTIGDIGIHVFNLIEYVTGEKVSELCAELSSSRPDRKLDDDVNMLLRFEKGGKGLLAVSQVAIGEENGLRVKIYGTKGSVCWEQENPNYLKVAYAGEPVAIYTRNGNGTGTLSQEVSRIPSGHPEGYLEAFANIYSDTADAIWAYIEGNPMSTEEYKFPTVYDGFRGMEFIYKAVDSSNKGASWISM